MQLPMNDFNIINFFLNIPYASLIYEFTISPVFRTGALFA